jgi:methylglyoxal synthase
MSEQDFSQRAGGVRMALIAHDAKKDDMVAWTGRHLEVLERARIVATGTTGGELLKAYPGLTITRMKSGPLGGDQQIGAMIADGRLDALIFFTDPLSPMPHDVDVKALTRLAVVYDLPMACSPATANIILDALARE